MLSSTVSRRAHAMKLKPILIFASGVMGGFLLGAGYVINSYSTSVLPAVERHFRLELVINSLGYANLIDQNYDAQQIRSRAVSAARDMLASIDAAAPLSECPLGLTLVKVSVTAPRCGLLASFAEHDDVRARGFLTKIVERTPPSFAERMDQAARQVR